MIYEYALDLRVARRKSGLSQSDCAHLLGVDPSRLSRLEAGKAKPSIYELSVLCFVFDTPPSGIHNRILATLVQGLGERLSSMPACPDNWPDQLNRQHTLNSLAARLEGLSQPGI